ncbi:metallophosphoesterase [Alsobacter sp. SYSU M60028]|uniref:Metallophosphoesterase n=1 Tax=Alsobacter ponti TaxID=2962936 RepID=A0ABT1L8T0_9HYPH|nr:metallophosphoesterase [Alsobacter ponti]MCP8937438.1 metallophosphoesterase [Alsobacter ponti]
MNEGSTRPDRPSAFRSGALDRRDLISALAALSVAPAALTSLAGSAAAQEPSGFSFLVYGDSRPMLYLPFKLEEREEAIKLLTVMFALILPEKVAEETVRREISLTYDPETHELVQIVMPLWTKSEITTLTVEKGWVTEASVEDIKLLPGVRRTIFRLFGGAWVAREIGAEIQSGKAQFIISTGDLVWWGYQGPTPSENPYWRLLHDNLLDRLPPPDAAMRATGLPGRVFPAVGNHEVWGDPAAQALLQVFPHLSQFGVSDKRLIYHFDLYGVRFIFLWTGKYDYRSPSSWDAERPQYEAQMAELKEWLEQAKTSGIRKVFISFHAPAFCRSSIGPIPEPQNPHRVIAPYARDLEIVVFNGHVHTTELYEVDGVKYLLLGNGGAEQDSILPGRMSIDVPENYPPDLYWKGQPRKEEYNYLRVHVQPGQRTRFTLSRFRPWSFEPFSTVNLFD